MTDVLIDAAAGPVLPVHAVTKQGWDEWLGARAPLERNWLVSTGFEPMAGALTPLPEDRGKVAGYVLGLGDGANPLVFGNLAFGVPEGQVLALDDGFEGDRDQAALGFVMGAYRFDKYKKSPRSPATMVVPKGVDGADVRRIGEGVALTRDLINTPTEDMGPQQLEAAAWRIADSHGAAMMAHKGKELLDRNFPMIHAVGRASVEAPRLIDMAWGNPYAPKITLVGKGVCFDSGGLDIKPASAMRLMKKDMGGAANVLGLATMIMGAHLNVRLRVLIPAVENAIAGNAFRPGDVIPTRKGISVEIGNTDAEGRLVLADALALGDEESPQMMIDMATLTGAARVAMGADLPPMFCDDDKLAAEIQHYSMGYNDPVWRLPIWQPYDKQLDSNVADVNNIADGGFGGAIIAALFLKKFVTQTPSWAHFDIYSWNAGSRPGRPAGGEAMAIRGLYAMLKDKYGG